MRHLLDTADLSRDDIEELLGLTDDFVEVSNRSIPIASRVSAVSRSDSPFFTDDVDTLKVMVSADSRLAAVSKDRRVRVESS